MKFILALTIFVTVLLLPVSALAETSASETSKTSRLEELQRKKEELRQRIQVKKATQEARLTQFKQARIKAYWEILQRRLLAHIERLERLIQRIESRLAKIEEEDSNINTTETVKQLEKAKNMLSDTKVKLEEANGMVEELLASENPKGAFKKIREIVQEVRDDLKEVHSILVHEIGKIKGLRVGQGKTKPTSSVTTTPTEVPTITP